VSRCDAGARATLCAAGEDIAPSGHAGILFKPFRAAALEEAVRAALAPA